MATQGSPVVARHRLRLALRQRREAIGRTQGDIAKSLDWSLSKLQRIEAGENAISTTDLQALLGQLKVTDPALISSLVAEAKVARRRSQWDEPRYRENLTPATRMLLDFEAEATVIRSFQTLTIPGVLQTRDFATEVFQALGADLTDEERQVRLEVRLQRRAHVLDRLNRPLYLLILDQSILLRALGGPEIFVAELQHILNDARGGRIQLRIAPFALPAGITAHIPFTVLSMEDDEDSILYRENFQSDEIIQAPDRVQRHLEIFAQLWEHSFPEDITQRLVEDRISQLRAEINRESTT